MNGYAASKVFLSHEEKLALVEEKSLSDLESEGTTAEVEARFSNTSMRCLKTVRRKVAQLTSILPSLRVPANNSTSSSLSSWSPTTSTSPTSMTRTYRTLPCPSGWSSTALRLAIFLIPSFLHGPSRRSDRLGPTAYLDGVRGVAALFVFFCHFFYTSFHLAEGWGRNGENYHVWKLPFIRLLVSGPSMVCLFFVVSGYALSLKPLKQMRSRSFDGLATTMASFIFRRAFRLFIPTAVSTFVVMVLLDLGVYEWTRAFASEVWYMRSVVEHHPLRNDTIREQFWNWFWEMFNFVHVFGWEKFGGSTQYDVHLWTIPVEYRCSLYLFLILIGTSRLRPGFRFATIAVVSWFSLLNGRWEMLLFIAGMALAEIDLIRGAHDPAPPPAAPSSPLSFDEDTDAERQQRQRKPCLGWKWILLSIPALYLLSEPDAGTENTPGWETLGSFIPAWFSDKYRFYQCWGAILFMVCVGRSPGWQRVFNLPFVQYLGRISFAIYLCHGPVMHTLGFAIERWAWRVTGTDDDAAFLRGFLVAAVFNVPLVFWASDVFWRAVDAPTVRFAKWLEVRLSIE